MPYPYVEKRDGNVYIGKSRVTLDSVIVPWRSGDSPDTIQEDYPSVPLADIYGAVAYYLEHRDEVEQYLHDTEQLWHELSTKQEAQHGAFLTTLRNRIADAQRRLEAHTADSRSVDAGGITTNSQSTGEAIAEPSAS